MVDPQRDAWERKDAEIDKLKEDLEEMRRNMGNAKFKEILGSALSIPAGKRTKKKDAPKTK